MSNVFQPGWVRAGEAPPNPLCRPAARAKRASPLDRARNRRGSPRCAREWVRRSPHPPGLGAAALTFRSAFGTPDLSGGHAYDVPLKFGHFGTVSSPNAYGERLSRRGIVRIAPRVSTRGMSWQNSSVPKGRLNQTLTIIFQLQIGDTAD